MIFGTSKIWSKSGPMYLLTITNMLQKIQENYGITLGKYYWCQYGTQTYIFRKCMSYVPCFFCVFSFFCRILNTYSWNIFTKMRIVNDKISSNEMYKNLDMNFISIKNTNWEFGNMYHISSGNIKHFLRPRNFLIFKEGNHQTLNSR